MPDRLSVTRERVIAYRTAAQGLDRTARAPGRLAVLDIGVQHAAGDAVRLAFDARLADTPPADGIGPGEPLALVWSLRAAPNVHRRSQLDALAGALWPMSEADAVARLDAAASVRKAGIPALDAYATSVQALRDVVTAPTAKGAASAGVTRRVPEALTRDCRACQARHVFELPFRMGTLPAGIELEPGTAPPVLVPRSGAKYPTGTDKAALRRLIVAYLRVLGPATSADVAGYLDMRRADVEAIWPKNLTEVDVDGRTGWLPADRVEDLTSAPPAEAVRLLNAFDPWMQARDRDLIVPDRAVYKTLWPVLGRPGVVLAEGEIVGTWRPKSAGKRLTLTVESFAPLPPSTWSAIEDEAQRVAAVRGATDVRVTRSG